ncbi:MAG: sugar ABC transporter ATP-binding protein [Devosia nanyangense]|uniref:Sugar ABC transporter ATP-binding protein n=1 Tax=Devosia nanyangense TaxID=1228055 RepID=A0A933P0H9_9HYPH|nr:sugar ABC transporter ATP-binding protein [Devosia nanyangense]
MDDLRRVGETTLIATVHDAASTAADQRIAALSATGLRKAYGATVALAQADITLNAGTVHALLGENGAGKSTLVRILTGAAVPDAGEIVLHGQRYAPRNLIQARAQGVATAFQELSLVPNLSVAQNLLLPTLPRGPIGLVSSRRAREAGAAILARHGMERIDPTAEVGLLPLAERQRIEIVRAIENAGRVLILDEPTASLAETEWLFERIRMVTAKGVAVLYISHRLAEVREICGEATVLRNGNSIASVSLEEATDEDIFEMMVGRRLDRTSRHRTSLAQTAGPTRLSVKGLGGHGLSDISFDLRPGEVLGLAALEGQGQRALFRMLAGIEKAERGETAIDGMAANLSSPRRALRIGSGVAYLPEERKTEGVLAGLSAATNVVLPIMSAAAFAAVITPQAELSAARPASGKVEMNARYLSFAIGDLSGGNQQKALVARTLATAAKTLLLHDPTRGVDVGTKQSIYAAIRSFAAEGGAVLFYSSELAEIVQLADRCLVLYGGRISQTFEGEAIAEQALVAAILGHAPSARARA